MAANRPGYVGAGRVCPLERDLWAGSVAVSGTTAAQLLGAVVDEGTTSLCRLLGSRRRRLAHAPRSPAAGTADAQTSIWSTSTPVTSASRARSSSCRKTHLRGPRRIVDLDEQRAVLQSHRPHVGRQCGPDGFLPAAEHATDLGPPGPATQRAQQPVECVGHRDRIVAAHWCTNEWCDGFDNGTAHEHQRSSCRNAGNNAAGYMTVRPLQDSLCCRLGRVIGGHDGAGDDVHDAVRRRRRRHRGRGRDHDLPDREMTEQRRGPAVVELGQDVVEHEHRCRPRALGDEPMGAQPHGQRQAALLALGGVGAAPAGR